MLSTERSEGDERDETLCAAWNSTDVIPDRLRNTAGTYSKPEKTVEIVNHLKNAAESGQQVFYSIYTEEEMQADSSLRDTGLFFFKGEDNAKFAVCNAGGGMAFAEDESIMGWLFAQ